MTAADRSGAAEQVPGAYPTMAEKNWATACSKAALRGYRLLRTDPVDGPVQVIAERYGIARIVLDIREVLE